MNALLRFVAVGCTLVASARAAGRWLSGRLSQLGSQRRNFLPFGHRLIEVNGEHVILEPRGIRRKGNPPPE